jgi:hypothetical protein
MSKLLARFLVQSACLVLPLAAANTPASESITIFVKGRSASLNAMRTEVARLMEPTGLTLEWKDIADRRAGEDFPRLVTVELRGQCDASLTAAGGPSQAVRSLASTAIVDGKVLPFSSVECDALRKVLAPAFVTSKRESWNQTMGRAMGRVFTHELFHMLAQSKAHHNAGVSKSCFSVADLTSDRFAFDSVTVAQLRPNAVEDPVAEFIEVDTGR